MFVDLVPIRLTQHDWNDRAALVGIAWSAEVVSATSKTPANCLACGHRWLARPATVARGCGCPECGRWKKRRIPQETWIERFGARGLEILEPVERSTQKVRVRCAAAGHILEVWPTDTRGCRMCREDARHTPQRVWDMRIAGVGAEWLEPVRGVRTPTRARCIHCGHTRLVVPEHVTSRADEPVCACPGQLARCPAVAPEKDPSKPVDTDASRTRRRCQTCNGELTAAPANDGSTPHCPACARRMSSADAPEAPRHGNRMHPSAATQPRPTDEVPRVAAARERARLAPWGRHLDTSTPGADSRRGLPFPAPWVPAPVGSDEPSRLAALYALEVLDTEPEPELDDVARLVAEICEAPMAFISLVDAQREFFKAHIGTSRRESPRDRSFCGHAIHANGLFVITDALEDPRFAGNPDVIGGDRVRFYAGAPLVTVDGHAVGMLCAKDTRPRRLSRTQERTLSVLGRHVCDKLELRIARRCARSAVAQDLRPDPGVAAP